MSTGKVQGRLCCSGASSTANPVLRSMPALVLQWKPTWETVSLRDAAPVTQASVANQDFETGPSSHNGASTSCPSYYLLHCESEESSFDHQLGAVRRVGQTRNPRHGERGYRPHAGRSRGVPRRVVPGCGNRWRHSVTIVISFVHLRFLSSLNLPGRSGTSQ